MVDGDSLRFLRSFGSVYRLALAAIEHGHSLASEAEDHLEKAAMEYDAVYAGESDWRLLPALDHPEEPARCLVSGTGLTHNGSARNRDAMHEAAQKGSVTDSLRMYEMGAEGGRPTPGCAGVQPEWFYKGSGTILRAHGDPLVTPAFAEDGGEESEVAGLYVIDRQGRPRRAGFAIGNEFSDHRMERVNYLYLAPSKLRTCAIGPELVAGDAFAGALEGRVRILRGEEIVWDKPFSTGEGNMCHTLANLEHHHFKYPEHRRPGDVHIHFFGADAFSFGEGVELANGDIMQIELTGFGRPLRNPIEIERGEQPFIQVEAL